MTMEIDDFCKIFADMEETQEKRLNQLKADLMETIAATKTEQKQDVAKICRNQDVLNKQMENLNTAKNGIDSQKFIKVINDLIELSNAVDSRTKWHTNFLYIASLAVIALLSFLSYQVWQLPEQTAEQLYQTYYANQPQTKSNAKKR